MVELDALSVELDALSVRVREELPELGEIVSTELRDLVVKAWALALSETEYQGITDIAASPGPGMALMKKGTQADHMRSTATVALGIAEGMEKVFGPMSIDHDVLIAGALLHDVGKAFEFSPRNRARWEANPAATGLPSVRHPAYGVYLTMKAGLPESIVHIVAAHSLGREGDWVIPSLEARIVQFADSIMWRVHEGAGLMEATDFYPYHPR